MRKEILRGGELAAMAGVPEGSREMSAAQRWSNLNSMRDRLHHPEPGFLPELGFRAAAHKSPRAGPLSVANG